MAARERYTLPFILFLISILLIQIKTVDIILSSSMDDTEQSTYSISNNILTLNTSGEYTISGSCSDCQILVEKSTSPSITLNSINIDNSKSGPFVIKKSAKVNLTLNGESTITDTETDESSDDYEGAGLKFKSSSTLTINGNGKLNVIGTIKNGIKGASGSKLIINGGTLNISAVNNALAADGSLTINDGTFIISTSEGDGIKSDPDYGDENSEGIVTINGGYFNISTYNDGIQASTQLNINGGSFYIKTYKNGSYSSDFDKDTESAKGLKCSTNETSDINLNINGGNFVLDTADDSIHSDGNVSITGGTFTISSGDDAVHADQYLILGKENNDNSLIKMNITKSYEGLEGSNVYIYSGTYNIISSDDGINSAGDTDEECQPGGNGNHPGGGGPRPWRSLSITKKPRQNLRKRLAECYTFHIYIYGGEIYVNAESDGLDANGNIVISGGNITVWGARSGVDGDPIDMDGTLTISGGTLLAGGNQGMTQIDRQAQNSQKYISSSGSFSSNQNVYILSDDTTIRTLTIPKNIQYIYYTSPNVDSTYKFSTTAGSISAQTSQTETNSIKTDSINDSTNSANSVNSDSINDSTNSVSTNSTNDSTNSSDTDSDEVIPKFILLSSNLKMNIFYFFAFALLI